MVDGGWGRWARQGEGTGARGGALRRERRHLTAEGADVDAGVVGGGGGEDVAGAEAVLVLEVAGLFVEAIEGAVDAADVEVAVRVGEAGVVDDVGDGGFPKEFAGLGVPGEGFAFVADGAEDFAVVVEGAGVA